MSFEVGGDAYGQFMGRWSEPLAVDFVAQLDLQPGQRALDVGCGPGALTTVLVDRLGAAAVSAVDPSESFVAAIHARLPDVDVRRASTDALPFDDDRFDLVAAQLVVHFMADPVQGIGEMARATRPDGLVAASVWDHGGDRGPLGPFWSVARELDPAAPDESELSGAREGDLARYLSAAGLRDVESSTLTVQREFDTFEDWWQPFLLGVGPAGAYLVGLDAAHQHALRDRCAQLLPASGAFTLSAVAWAAQGRA